MGGKVTRNVSDEELVRRAQARPTCEEEREAGAELLTRYQSRVYGLCFYYVGNPELARDLAQDVLLRAYENLGSFRATSRFAAWIYAITRNRCRSELKRAKVAVAEEVDPDQLEGRSSDPVDELVRRSDEETLMALIRERLSKEEQTALWLRCVEKMPLATLTGLLDLDQASGARTVLQRARRKLRAAMDADPSLGFREK
ncbi:RNA polymerase sigma factor [Candidatus Eisenbacteria bacterium]|uniref:RNA polymerase sigma factor n=1 Tax=Eiseniibacteriota bacterium TaxID=2212470 RepID=A0ABV6YL11_UNCEI